MILDVRNRIITIPPFVVYALLFANLGRVFFLSRVPSKLSCSFVKLGTTAAWMLRRNVFYIDNVPSKERIAKSKAKTYYTQYVALITNTILVKVGEKYSSLVYIPSRDRKMTILSKYLELFEKWYLNGLSRVVRPTIHPLSSPPKKESLCLMR